MTDKLPVIAATRIPFHPIVQERYGIAAESWRALVDSVFPAAKTIEGVMLALSYCKARNLDVFKRPVHIVPIWNSAIGREVETVWPGIGELRTTAFRTGQYAGAEDADYGMDITRTFRGEVGRGDRRRQVEETVTFPEWAQVTLHRLDRTGQARKWPGPRVYWLETYQKQGKSEVPNEMWSRRPRGQLEKCAEAAALRRAFPEEIGEQFIGDEAREMLDITPAHDHETGEISPVPMDDPMDRVVAEQQATNGDAAAAQVPVAARAGPPSPRRGRPKKPETVAREIIAEIETANPEDADALLNTHSLAIAELPDELRTEVVAAAQDRANQLAEDDADDIPIPAWIDDEGEPPAATEPTFQVSVLNAAGAKVDASVPADDWLNRVAGALQAGQDRNRIRTYNMRVAQAIRAQRPDLVHDLDLLATMWSQPAT